MEPSLSAEEGDKATEITMKDFKKALSTAKGDSKLLIDADINFNPEEKTKENFINEKVK